MKRLTPLAALFRRSLHRMTLAAVAITALAALAALGITSTAQAAVILENSYFDNGGPSITSLTVSGVDVSAGETLAVALVTNSSEAITPSVSWSGGGGSFTTAASIGSTSSTPLVALYYTTNPGAATGGDVTIDFGISTGPGPFDDGAAAAVYVLSASGEISLADVNTTTSNTGGDLGVDPAQSADLLISALGRWGGPGDATTGTSGTQTVVNQGFDADKGGTWAFGYASDPDGSPYTMEWDLPTNQGNRHRMITAAFTSTAVSVPEPASLLVAALGLLSMGFLTRRRRRRR